jgi:Uncharacterised protein family (UPF0164)
MKQKLLILIFLLVAGPLYAQLQNASTGLTFLKLGVGGRAIGMGEAYSALSNDAAGIYYNPAGIATGSEDEITFMHKDWVFGTAIEYLGAIVHTGSFALGFGLNSTNVDNIEIRQEPGPALGTFGVHDLAISATASWRVDTSLSIGATGKFLYEKIYVDESSGAAFDVGAKYQLNRNVAVAAAISNIGSTSELASTSTSLPSTYRFGAAYSSETTGEFGYTFAADLLKVPQDAGSRFHVGAETVYDSFLSLRAGYQFGYDAKGYSVGLGVRYGLVQIDYAFVPFLDDLGNTHTFALTFNF